MVIDANKEILTEKQLTRKELAALKALKTSIYACIRIMCIGTEEERKHLRPAMNRTVYAGDSTEALGWTDGEEYIAISRIMLQKLNKGIIGADKVATTWIHEVCHEKGKTDVHGLEFYQRFHNIITERTTSKFYFNSVSYLAYHINRNYAINLLKEGINVPDIVSKSIRQNDKFWTLMKQKNKT